MTLSLKIPKIRYFCNIFHKNLLRKMHLVNGENRLKMFKVVKTEQKIEHYERPKIKVLPYYKKIRSKHYERVTLLTPTPSSLFNFIDTYYFSVFILILR